MQKVQAFLKAHWKPFAIAVAAGIVVWFLFLRKNGAGQSVLTLPGMATGGGGSVGASTGSASGATGSGNDNSTSSGSPLPSLSGPGDAVTPTYWRNPLNGAIYLVDSLGKIWLSYTQWLGILQNNPNATYTNVDPNQLNALPNVPGFPTNPLDTGGSGTSAGAKGGPPHGLLGPAPQSPKAPFRQRGSGFRGGDVYPAAWGNNRPIDARIAASAQLPAAPLGTSVAPKQPLSTDVRRAPRGRQTSMAQIARGAPPRQLPQSFSVPVRQHDAGKKPVLTIQAQSAVNATAAGGGQIQSAPRVQDGMPVPAVAKRH